MKWNRKERREADDTESKEEDVYRGDGEEEEIARKRRDDKVTVTK